jgi:hypothetical protein
MTQTMPRNSFIKAVILFELGVTCHRSYAQEVGGAFLGTVKDSSGAVVAGGKVIATATATGLTHEATTYESGNYTLPGILPGNSTVTVEAKAFKRITQENIDRISNTSIRVDITLQPGTVSETVTVPPVPPLLQTDYFRSAGHEANSNTPTTPFKSVTTCNASVYYELCGGYTPNGKGQIYGPATGNPDRTARTPLAGNRIPYSVLTGQCFALRWRLHLLHL